MGVVDFKEGVTPALDGLYISIFNLIRQFSFPNSIIDLLRFLIIAVDREILKEMMPFVICIQKNRLANLLTIPV